MELDMFRMSSPKEDIKSGKEMSLPEKDVLCHFIPEAPELPYPLHTLETRGTPEQEYEIPDEDRAKVLEQLWPFEDTRPKLESQMYDLHSEKVFNVRDYRVIRCRGRNLLCAPDYPQTGGMLVDWIPDIKDPQASVWLGKVNKEEE